MGRERALPQRLRRDFRIRRGRGEIAAHREQHLALAARHRADGADHVVTVRLRRRKPELGAQAIQEGQRGFS